MRERSDPQQTAHLIGIITAVLLMLLIVGAQLYHFERLDYRQDEAWRVHYALDRTIVENVRWLATNLHPPLWQIAFDVWVDLFGDREPITRWQSVLYTTLTLAFAFRLGNDLFGCRAGLLTLVLLGTLPFAFYHSHEARSYSLFLTGAAAAPLFLLRWMRQPTFRRALLFVVAGIIVVFTHFFGLLYIFALGIACFILLRPSRAAYLRAVGIFAAIGLSFIGWLPSFLHSFLVLRPRGISYSLEQDVPESLAGLYYNFSTQPEGIGLVLLLFGLFAPVGISQADARFRFGATWRKVFILVVPVSIVLIAVGTNLVIRSLTARNLIITLPMLALIATFALMRLPDRFRWVVAVMLLISAYTNFRPFYPIYPNRDMIAHLAPQYEAGEPFIIDFSILPEHITVNYYLQKRLPVPVANDVKFHLINGETNSPIALNMPARPVYLINNDDEMLMTQFATFLDRFQRQRHLWFIRSTSNPTSFGERYRQQLEQVYVEVGQHNFDDEMLLYQYRRIPFDLAQTATFGSLTMFNWVLLSESDVAACESVTVESWWRAQSTPSVNYSMTLVVVGADGSGIVNSDGAPAGVLTLQWQPGQALLDTRTLTIPCETPPGDYPLMIGVYNPTDGVSLGDLFYLTTLRVTSP